MSRENRYSVVDLDAASIPLAKVKTWNFADLQWSGQQRNFVTVTLQNLKL